MSKLGSLLDLYGADPKAAVLLLVRHGETLWNAENRVQGHADSPLSERGIIQAKTISSFLADESITAAYSSDLSRAYETARIIAEPHGCTVVSCPELREADYGEWTGLLMSEVKSHWPEITAAYAKDPTGVKIPGGESARELMERACLKSAEIASAHQGQTVLVCAHGGSIRAIIAGVLNSPNILWRFKLGNAGISIIEWGTQNPRLLALNILSHLQNLQQDRFSSEESI